MLNWQAFWQTAWHPTGQISENASENASERASKNACWRTFLRAGLVIRRRVAIALVSSVYLTLLLLPLQLGWPAAAAAAPAASAADSLFAVNCAGCHAGGGNIIRRGKTLKQKALVRNGYADVAAIAALITQGKGIMPAYADRLSSEEIDAIAQYVQQQAETGW